jgi:hypothetical protein
MGGNIKKGFEICTRFKNGGEHFIFFKGLYLIAIR